MHERWESSSCPIASPLHIASPDSVIIACSSYWRAIENHVNTLQAHVPLADYTFLLDIFRRRYRHVAKLNSTNEFSSTAQTEMALLHAFWSFPAVAASAGELVFARKKERSYG